MKIGLERIKAMKYSKNSRWGIWNLMIDIVIVGRQIRMEMIIRESLDRFM